MIGGKNNTPNPLRDTTRSFPNLSVTSAWGFDDVAALREVSCLQLTRTGVFFPWRYSRVSGPAVGGKLEHPKFISIVVLTHFFKNLARGAPRTRGDTGRLCCIDLTPPHADTLVG
jgi:hypothetical protein